MDQNPVISMFRSINQLCEKEVIKNLYDVREIKGGIYELRDKRDPEPAKKVK